jgi:hypothetical protein
VPQLNRHSSIGKCQNKNAMDRRFLSDRASVNLSSTVREPSYSAQSGNVVFEVTSMSAHAGKAHVAWINQNFNNDCIDRTGIGSILILMDVLQESFKW